MADAYVWGTMDASAAMPPGADTVLGAIEGLLGSVQSVLEAVKATFTVMKSFIVDYGDILETILGTIRDDIAAVVETMEESGVYFMSHVPQSPAVARSPRTWLTEVVTSMSDPGDPNRPDFSEPQDFGGALLMVVSPDFNELLGDVSPLVNALFRKFKLRDGDIVLKNSASPPPRFVIDKSALRAAYNAQLNNVANVYGSFRVGDVVIGEDSGATAKVVAVRDTRLGDRLVEQLQVNTQSFKVFAEGERVYVGEVVGATASGVIGTYVPGNTTRGQSKRPDWEPPKLLIDLIPPLGTLANVLKKALGFLVFGQGLSALIQQYIDFLDVKIAALDSLVTQIQEVTSIFDQLLSLPAVHVLFFEATSRTTRELQTGILDAGLPESITELGLFEAPQGDGTTQVFQLAPADHAVAAGAAVLVAAGPGGEIANTVGLLKGLLGAT